MGTSDAPAHTATRRRLWHSKVDRVLNKLRHSSKHYRMPSTQIAIDEFTIKATGQSQDAYKMPSKPTQQGFKFQCLADHGNTWSFHPNRTRPGLILFHLSMAGQAFGEEQEKGATVPLYIDDYNRPMRGVATFDRPRCCHDLQKVSWRA